MSDIEDPLADTPNGDEENINDYLDDVETPPETNGGSPTKSKTPAKRGRPPGKSDKKRKKKSFVMKISKKKYAKKAVEATTKENEDGDYEVEAIVGHKKEKGKTLYEVKWKGYSSKHNSFVAAADLNCKPLLNRYKKKIEKINEDTYEVDKIIDHRSWHGTIWYRIRWVGYHHTEDTWQEKSELSCGDLIKEYHENVNKDILKREKEKAKAREEAKSKDGEYEVEFIVDKKISKKSGNAKYLVRWKGWDSSSDSWINEDDVNCPELIRAFDKKKAGAKKVAKKRKRESDSDDDDSDYGGGKKTQYEVAKICNARINKQGKWEFYVLWKGYGPEDCNWEPESNLNCDGLITEYFGKNKIPKAVKNELEKEEAKAAAAPPKKRKPPAERKTLSGRRTKGALKTTRNFQLQQK